MTSFSDLGLAPPLCKAIGRQGYTVPTPIQAQAIPPLLQGRDVLGCAQTGTGKTAAFALPILQHLLGAPRGRGKPIIRVLVLTPTRELAAQIGESFANYGHFLETKHVVIFGGVNENPQIRALRQGIDILVATPGRLLDLHSRNFVDLNSVDFFVLDEADRMLDMGFVHDVRRVLRVLPKERQNLLFSATMPSSIVKLAGSFLVEPVHVEVTPTATTVEKVEQTVMFVDRGDKPRLLASLLKKDHVSRAIVFTRTKHGANKLSGQLEKAGLGSAAIHGNKSQGARTRALEGFRAGKIGVLVATDVAARGIDIDDVSHVFNYDLPNIPESYVHRIGRTARAGRGGVAIAFCDASEGEFLRDIEKTIGMELLVDDQHAWHSREAEHSVDAPSTGKKPAASQGGGRGRGGGGGGGGGRRGGGRAGAGARSGGGGAGGRGRGKGRGGSGGGGGGRGGARGQRGAAKKG